jgi:hypothetical protein
MTTIENVLVAISMHRDDDTLPLGPVTADFACDKSLLISARI